MSSATAFPLCPLPAVSSDRCCSPPPRDRSREHSRPPGLREAPQRLVPRTQLEAAIARSPECIAHFLRVAAEQPDEVLLPVAQSQIPSCSASVIHVFAVCFQIKSEQHDAISRCCSPTGKRKGSECRCRFAMNSYDVSLPIQ
jgi:hypothetical protein